MFVSARSDPLQMMRQVADAEFHDDSSQDDDADADISFDDDQQGEPRGQPTLANSQIKEFDAKDAARATNCVGYLVLCLLIFSGALLSILTHFYVQGEENEDFEHGFNVSANDLLASVDQNAKNLHSSLTNVARLYPSYADNSEEESPILTIRDWEAFAMETRQMTGARLLSYAPLLLEEDGRTEWEPYSVAQQSWIKESANAFYSDDPIVESIDPISPRIWLRDGNGQDMIDPGPAPYMPIWQTSPPPVNDTWLVNYNLAADKRVEDWIELQLEQNTTWSFLAEPVNHLFIGGDNFPADDKIKEPGSLAWIPVLQTLMSQEETLTGAIVADIPWSALLRNVLPSEQGQLFVVVESCGLLHTYSVEPPTQPLYLGEGDLHDPTYDGLGVEGELGTFPSGRIGVATFCRHKITVYPSESHEKEYESSSSPHVFAVGTAVCFFFAIVLFLCYDGYVRIQQNRVVGHAERSQALVASLFPTQVARRLFESNRSTAASVLDQSNHSAHLLNFMNKSDRTLNGANINMEERPIAELFPEATVMFADIAGFTAWSSIREPTQVFQLLEAIFQAFDEEARKADVFKVETVGDCYVAVSGVPEPCSDHAEVMAKFARGCLYQFNKVVRGLELILGPDTGDLAMRIGLNSGPVTAGVLRGERARFQLFGDTVNTASRIETTGQRDRVHLSEQTAKYLKAAGRTSWIVRREDAVQAKGKGLINTFWLVLDDGNRIDASEGAYMSEHETIEEVPMVINSDGDGDGDSSSIGSQSRKSKSDPYKSSVLSLMDATTARKIERLVAWNTELLLQLLKHIIAKRSATTSRKIMPAALSAMAQNIGTGMVVDEVTEVIQLPDFDERLASKKIDANAVILSPEVVAQTRRFVSLIASMYRDNPFHNFEHASHVTMSVSKLLSRIVAPQIDKDKLSVAKQQEELILHDHTYGITSDPLTQFSVVLSALIHDVDHRGVPNFILQEEDKYLASVYNNKSIAEQNSVDLAWNTLMEPEFDALRSIIFVDISELKRFRQLLVNSVIATDIFDKELGTLRKNRWTKAFSVAPKNRTNKDIHRMATIVIEHLIQASDVAHTMQHWHVYRKWNERLFQEMYRSYTNGRWDKDPSEGWYKGEIGFFDNYIIPLAKKLKECGVFGVSSDEYLNYALENRQEWEAKGEGIVKSLVERYAQKEMHPVGMVL